MKYSDAEPIRGKSPMENILTAKKMSADNFPPTFQCIRLKVCAIEIPC